jgi:hypothetical protein
MVWAIDRSIASEIINLDNQPQPIELAKTAYCLHLNE